MKVKVKYVGDMYAPEKTKFMDVVDFKLGQITEVDDKLSKQGINILQKLRGNGSFIIVENDKDALPVLDAVVEEVQEEPVAKKGKK